MVVMDSCTHPETLQISEFCVSAAADSGPLTGCVVLTSVGLCTTCVRLVAVVEVRPQHVAEPIYLTAPAVLREQSPGSRGAGS